MSDFALIGAARRIHEKLPSWAPNVFVGYVFAAIAVLILPSPLNHFSTIDPIIYQSYIHDYKYMVGIYGYTYYAIRVAWIIPATLFQHLFGDGGGYLLVRIFLLGGAASAFSILVDRLFRRPYGLYAAVWVVFSPTLLREMTHNYGDGAAFCYAYLALACVFTQTEKSKLQHAWGGVFLGLAFNTYPLAATAAIMAVPAWLFLRRKNSAASNVLCALSASSGFVAIYAVIAASLWAVFTAAGQPFELIPLSVIKSQSAGGAAIWQVPLSEIFLVQGDWSRAYPLFVLAAVVIFVATKARGTALSSALAENQDGLIAAALMCGVAVVLYLALHVFAHVGVIVWPWMYDFVLPGCALGSIGLICAVTPSRYDRWAIGVGSGLLIAPYLFGVINGGLPYTPSVTGLWAGLAMSGAIVLVRLFKAPPLLMGALAAAVLMIFPLTFYSTASFGSCGYPGEVIRGRWLPARGSYAGCIFRPTALPVERDLQTGTLALMDDVKRVDPVDAPGIWYANNNGFGDEVGSAFLWQYSRIASTSAGDPGMPNLDAYAKSQISKYNTVVLVAASQHEIDTATQVLDKSGYALTALSRRRVGGPHFSFDYVILHKNPIDPKLYVEGPVLNPALATGQNGAQITFEADGMHVRTPPKRWSDAVYMPLSQFVTVDTAFVEVDLTVKTGMIGANILPMDKKDFLGSEIGVFAHHQAQKIYVPVSLYDRQQLVLRNTGLGPSTVVIHSVRLVERKTVPAKP